MEEAAEKIIRQAITETGLIQGGEIKAKCPNPDSVSSFADLPQKEKIHFDIKLLSTYNQMATI